MKAFFLFITLAVAVAVCQADPPTCDASKGEEYSTCHSPCPLTCSNYNDPVGCIASCAANCDCPRGKVRRESDQQCIDPKDC
ncbi:venom peptide SjAPI-2-like isoform X3 [Parasteatoda tepidariorum]|uniref:venom peptide SjAPI-2-like isoform X3 n=1 Tax=Parasteatoda tepidariorum TaxID=114398 RepID=UPI00077FAD7A|nr:venom peptide SjAPI-2-like isoform X3 [Parasteatoda tepidariorum]